MTDMDGGGEDDEGQCETKGWMASEMEKSMYSPIKADRNVNLAA